MMVSHWHRHRAPPRCRAPCPPGQSPSRTAAGPECQPSVLVVCQSTVRGPIGSAAAARRAA
eukprot:484897-Hanusia_phi.AAC.3